ncbi:conserved hypothetical protein [gamma proteobacterium NOR5-3]|nr:conserved hypothetical protein [gamma proteobacterium NOR5-3]
MPQGVCFNHRKLALSNANGEMLNARLQVTALWPDNSIQWILVRMQQSLAPTEALSVGVARRPVPSHVAPAQETLRLSEDNGGFTITDREQTLRFEADELGAFSYGSLRGAVQATIAGHNYAFELENSSYERVTGPDGLIAIALRFYGQITTDNGQTLNCRYRATVYADGRIDGDLSIHNPSAACHPGGLWDLGDPNSVRLDSASITLRWPDDKAVDGAFVTGPEDDAVLLDGSMSLVQHSSGGEHWDSPVHIDHRGRIPFAEPGFTLRQGDAASRGRRADPAITVNTGQENVTARIHDFWQRFPTGLTAGPGELTLNLLPKLDYAHELQPGERFSQAFTLLLAGQATPADTKLAYLQPEVTLDPTHVARCDLPLIGTAATINDRIGDLIAQGLDGHRSFVAKREAIDEYGWRHYGELYADHETDNYAGDGLFVSHYNNQYDPLMGFIRQSLVAPDVRWSNLAMDLARHVVDIDIYGTDEDRPEYNRGLFWHTDHYLPAETATHRSYSKRQPANAYDGHAHGGGPGGQHCYTAGLLHHYLLTGEEDSRDALYGLKHWIRAVYEGSGMLIDIALAIKNHNQPGLKNHLTGQYPLDRGVANYLNALLDCFALDHSASTLRQVEHIIRHTVHPSDAIETRDLGNVEDCWFYVVCLQALARYLQVKASREQHDEAFLYARDTLLHYADWMLTHEAPYLHKPEILEFPNHTWAAQDLRKANVLFEAAYFSPDDPEPYEIKAREFVDYVADTLSNSDTLHYTRIQALLLQNLSPTRARFRPKEPFPPKHDWPENVSAGVFRQMANLTGMLWRALRDLQPRREYAGIKRLLSGTEGMD